MDLDDDETEELYVLARCSLCLSPLSYGEKVIIGYKKLKGETFEYNGRYFVSHSIPQTTVDTYLGLEDSHSDYFEWGEIGLDDPEEFGKVRAYNYLPPPGTEEARFNRTFSFLTRKLQKQFPQPHLPAEVWAMIVRPLVRECLISQLVDLWLKRTRQVHKLDLAESIWAHYIYVDGRRYVSRLTNTPEPPPLVAESNGEEASHQPQRTTGVKVYDGESRPESVVVYFAADHFGVRHVEFTDFDKEPSSKLPTNENGIDDDNNLWWRTRTLGRRTLLTTFSDWFRVLDIGYTEDSDAPDERVAITHSLDVCQEQRFWTTPMSPRKLDRISIIDPRGQTRQGHGPRKLMNSIVLNHPDATGYSFFYYKGIRSLHTHFPGEGLSFYRYYDALFPEDGLWVYMPWDPKDLIQHVFFRQEHLPELAGLMLVTKDNKYLQIACQSYNEGHDESDNDEYFDRRLPPGGGNWADHHLSLPPYGSPARLYYQVSQSGRVCFCLENARTYDALCVFQEIATPDIPPVEWPFHAKAQLKDVSTIRLFCRTRNEFDPPRRIVAGILFEYSDGRTPACLGQYRFDQANTSIDVTESEGLHLGYHPDRHRSLLEVRTEPVVEGSSLKWLSMEWDGLLEMFFTASKSQAIYHRRKRFFVIRTSS